ncbi:MAG: T9SS type A sorting domain-containing protein, partial [Ignavibacteria bacterium]|nr:T9SS type A sorting domain-containing protein [Ignavibacteria bacterium]
MALLVIGDVDRDGKPEFANGAQGSPYLTLYSNNLIKLPGWPNEGVGEHYATPTIGRLSFSNDLIVADNNWDAFDPIGFGNIFAYNKDGSPLPWSPLRPIGLVNSISLADLNNDGSVEIIAISSKTGSETYLHIWTVPGIPYTNETFPWPQNGHDRYKSNQYGFIARRTSRHTADFTAVPERFSLSQNYPNPLIRLRQLSLKIRTSSNVKFTIFDALGRQLESLVNQRLNTGTYSLTFDGGSFSSGVYFYKLDAGEFS